jgi:Tfp pilus assembly protein PilN
MMRHINLVPAHRRDAKRRRTHMKWCGAGCAMYAAVATIATAIAWGAWAGEDQQVRQQIARADEEIHRSEQVLSETRIKFAADQHRLTAAQEIAEQPDWSLLLTLLAQKADDQMVLRSCQLRPAGDPVGEGKTTDAPTGPGLVVVVTGVARSPQAAQQYVLRLEKTGLFERVTLVETRREPFLNGEASAFRADCVLSTSAPPAKGAQYTDGREAP